MSWLRNVRRAVDEFELKDRHFDRDAAAWAAWAAQHGWTYQADATAELSGSYRPKYEYGWDQYCHVLTTQLHGLHVRAFEYRRYSQGSQGSEPIRSVQRHLVLHLPGSPPPEFIKMGATKAFRQLGGSAPSGWDFGLVGDELVGRGQGSLNRMSLESDAENLSVQVAKIPVSFWRPPS